jgi:hypothetical protein
MNLKPGTNFTFTPSGEARRNVSVIVSGFCMTEPDTEQMSDRGTTASFLRPRTRNVAPSSHTCLSGKQIHKHRPNPKSQKSGKSGIVVSALRESNMSASEPIPKRLSHKVGKITLYQVVALDDSCMDFSANSVISLK